MAHKVNIKPCIQSSVRIAKGKMQFVRDRCRFIVLDISCCLMNGCVN